MAARPDAPWLAFWLASISGLAEPIGAIVALVVLRNTPHLPLENVLATVAGIMCMVAVIELYPEAVHALPPPVRSPSVLVVGDGPSHRLWGVRREHVARGPSA